MQSAVGGEEEAAAAPAGGGFIIYPSQMSLTFVTSSRARRWEQLIRSDKDSSSFPAPPRGTEEDLTRVQLCSLSSPGTPGGGMQKSLAQGSKLPQIGLCSAPAGAPGTPHSLGFPLPTDLGTTL